MPFASLFKAATGVCIASLMERETLSFETFETQVSQALARTMPRTGGPSDPWFLQATVSEPLVHRGGFGPSIGGDVDGDMANWLRRNSGGLTAFDEQLRWLFAHRLP